MTLVDLNNDTFLDLVVVHDDGTTDIHLNRATAIAAAAGHLTAIIDWSLPSRFGLDANHDGLIDYFTTAAAISPTMWPVHLDGCGSVAGSSPITGYAWMFDGNAAGTTCAVDVDAPSARHVHRHADGHHAGRHTATTTTDILVKDLLIVSLGDSIASGEGNPDIAWDLSPFATNGVFNTPKWELEQCDRSALAGTALAAKRLENADPHTSVTFIHLACSGGRIVQIPEKVVTSAARTSAGQIAMLPGPRVTGDVKLDVTAATSGDTLTVYVETSPDGTTWTTLFTFTKTGTGELTESLDLDVRYYRIRWAISGGSFTFSVSAPDGHGGLLEPYRGINEPAAGDAPLAPQLTQLLALIGSRVPDAILISTGANDIKFSDVIKKCITTDCRTDPETLAQLADLFAQLPGKYTMLADALIDAGIDPSTIYLTEYPEQTQNGAGIYTSIIGIPEIGIGAITPEELEWAHTNVVVPLTAAVHAAAAAHDWHVVSGISDQFVAHGYASDDHWVVQLGESLLSQKDINGSFHPNAKGQDVYARQIFGALAPALGVSGVSAGWLGFSDTPTTLDDRQRDLGRRRRRERRRPARPHRRRERQRDAPLHQLRATTRRPATGTGSRTASRSRRPPPRRSRSATWTPTRTSTSSSATTARTRSTSTTARAPSPPRPRASSQPAPTNTTAVALADLNGDHRVDMIVANNGAAGQVFLNKDLDENTGVWSGFATTASATFGSATLAATSLAVGDADNDGLLDIVVGTATGSTNLLFVNRGGKGTNWQGLKAAVAIGTETDATTGVAVANVSGGSGPDILVVNDGTANLFYKPTPSKLTRLAAANVSATLGTDAIGIEEGEGAFVITTAGLAGSFSGKVTASAGGFDANISIRVRINSTPNPVDETIELGGSTINIRFSETEVKTVANGTFFQFSGSGVIKLGDFVEIRGTITFGSGETTGSGLTIFLGQGPLYLDGTTTINPDAKGVYVTNASFRAIEVGGQRAFSAVGDVAITGFPGIGISGTNVRVKFNATGAAQFCDPSSPAGECNGDDAVASGTALNPTASFSGILTVSLLGHELTGPVAFSKGSIIVTLGGALNDGQSVDFSFGPVDVSIDYATFEIGPTGIVATLTADVTLDLPGVSIDDGTFTLLINTTPTPATSPVPIPARSVRVKAEGLKLTVGGVTLEGNFEFEQVTGQLSPQAVPGTLPPKIVRFAASEVHFSFGGIVEVMHGHGLFIVTQAGIAGQLEAEVTAPFFTGTFGVAINTTMKAVSEQLQVGPTTVALNLPAGPYLRVQGTGIRVEIGGQRLVRRRRLREGEERQRGRDPRPHRQRERELRRRDDGLRHGLQRLRLPRPAFRPALLGRRRDRGERRDLDPGRDRAGPLLGEAEQLDRLDSRHRVDVLRAGAGSDERAGRRRRQRRQPARPDRRRVRRQERALPQRRQLEPVQDPAGPADRRRGRTTRHRWRSPTSTATATAT